MTLKLYNSLTRRVEPFVPADPQRVTMYVCGPTVYNYIHIGNARPAVVFDLLARLLRQLYPKVVYARNITDIDDKINDAAQQAGVPISDITTRYAAAYREDIARLGVDPPDIEPHATEHIEQIIAMIESLIERGHAYAAESHVLFNVASYDDYGQLSRRSLEDMIAGARVDVAPYKKNPADFVLWKPSDATQPGWDSPWGRGRPGWHIECSAMIAAHLGETIDIHAGGNDLMFPHHENEIAQSTCAHDGRTFARYWLHNGMLTFDGRKMSKSIGNVLTLHELLDSYRPEVLRLLLLRAHYRQPLDWSDDTLEQAERTLNGWYGVLRDLDGVDHDPNCAIPQALMDALLDDMNTPAAFAALAGLADSARAASVDSARSQAKSALLRAGGLLGLLQQDPQAWFQRTDDAVASADIQQLVDARTQAKQERDFARADALREQLLTMGIVVEDTAQGSRWKRQANGTQS